jgi:hypothetical protein
MPNLHRLLAGTGLREAFRQKITLPDDEHASFIAARDLIRQRLRQGFRDLSGQAAIRKEFLLEKAFRTTARAADLTLSPRFRMQGSFSYHTVNDPAWVPPQKVDLDDGVYLPTSFVNQESPEVAADSYFTAVENILRPLCRAQGWKLCEGERAKSSCVRVMLATKGHIDLPLYAIPDEEFADDRILAKSMRGIYLQDEQTGELSNEGYRSLPSNQIMLAHREGWWERSDPRKLDDWFDAAKRVHGDVLRFTCRYMKAWRDHHWNEPGSGPSSICLMACVVVVFDESQIAGHPLSGEREDLAVLQVASRLTEMFQGSIANPAVDGAENLDADWPREKRFEFIHKARDLHQLVHGAIESGPAESSLALMERAFGTRMPTDTALVLPDREEARILNTPRVITTYPAVGRSRSG